MTTECTNEPESIRKEHFVVGAAVNDDETLKSNLAASPLLAGNGLVLVEERGAPSATVAYNKIIESTHQPYLIFAHQDVYLPMSFERQLLNAIQYLNETDPNWAILGIVGKDSDACVAGLAWSNGLGCKVGRRIEKPHTVVSVDELLIVLRRNSGIKFDDALPGFHLYGTDIVLDAVERGFNSYAIDAPVVHNSVTVTHLDDRYVNAYRFMQKKWAHRLPLTTLIVPVSRTLWPIYRSHLSVAKRWLRGLRPVVERHPHPADLAKSFEFEDAP